MWQVETFPPGNCPRQSTSGRGKGCLCQQSSTLSITDASISLLLSPRGYLFAEYKGDPAPSNTEEK